MSIDGTDFRIREPTPFYAKWYSHKFNSAALRYEIGICFGSGQIVWINGPFAAGRWADQAIFSSDLEQKLFSNEVVLADLGYSGPKIVHDNLQNDPFGYTADRLRSYHERINGRLKMFNCLQNRFRHKIEKHNYCLFAVANVVQIELENR